MRQMARGWESKSVESQQEASAARAAERPPKTNRQQQLESLALSRKHLLEEIAQSANPRFRQLKQKALAHLDRQIEAALSSTG